MDERKQFTMYESIYKALQRIRKKPDRADAYDAICAYALYQIEPDMDSLTDAAAIAFDLIRPVLDSSRKKAANGKQGGSKQKANGKQTVSEKEKEKEKEIEIEIENECLYPAGEVVRLYEKFCPGLVRCEILSAGTKKAIADRFREHGDLAVFERLFRLAGNSDFLNGRKGSWRASLDWLMEERNFAKVLNGVYDNRSDPRAIPNGASGELGAAELEAIARVLREE